MIFREINHCLKVLIDLQNKLHISRVILSSPSPDKGSTRVITCDPSSDPDILTIPGCADPVERVMATNSLISLNEIRPHPGKRGCPLHKAEELNAFLGVPIQDCRGVPVACLSIASHLPRIWSFKEAEILCLTAGTLRALNVEIPAKNWHEILHRHNAG